MALARTVSRLIESATSIAMQIANGVQTFAGGWAGIRGPSHPTTQGFVVPFNDEAGQFFTGGHLEDETLGDTTASPIPKNTVGIQPKVYPSISVAGVTGRGDILKPAYLTDDDTWTLTRPANATINAIVIEHRTGAIVDLLVGGAAIQAAMDLAGAGRELLYLGHYDADTIANGDLRINFPVAFHGALVSLIAIVDLPLVGAGGTVAINMEINGVDVTGGVVTPTTAGGGTKGTRFDSTAVTADGGEVFRPADTIDIEAAASTDFTAGTLDLYALVEHRLGA